MGSVSVPFRIVLYPAAVGEQISFVEFWRARHTRHAGEGDHTVFAHHEGTRLWLQARGTLPEAPINGRYLVEPSGKLPLGAVYGRVDLAGLTIEEAELAIEQHLSQTLNAPKVMASFAPLGVQRGD